MTIEVGQLVSILGLLVSVGGSLYAWIVSQGKAALPEIEGLRKEINKLRHDNSEAVARVAKLESELAHMPDKDVVHKIELGLQAVSSRVEAQTLAMQEIRALLERALSIPEPMPAPVAAKPRRR